VDVRAWLRHLMRDAGDTPSVAEAFFCAVLILLMRFFMNFALPQPNSGRDMAVLALVTQLVVILTPAVLMAVMLTRSPRKTLLLRLPRWHTLGLAALLAVFLHPAFRMLQAAVMTMYPVDDRITAQLERLLSGPQNLLLMLLVLAVVPAICEELAFRGFILSGLRHMGHRWRAIIISSLFFGMAHALFQQTIIARFPGVLIGYIAVQTSSVLPCMVFHMCHNGLAVVLAPFAESGFDFGVRWLVPLEHALTNLVVGEPTLGVAGLVVVGLVPAGAILYRLHRLDIDKSAEETLQEAIGKHAPQSAAGYVP
jgi:sodium transport system permease protein